MTCWATSTTYCSSTSPANGSYQQTYDNEGNMATWQNTPTSPTQAQENLYDGEGNRVEQLFANGSTVTTTASISSLEEVATTGSTTTTTANYFFAGEKIALAVNGTFSFLGNDPVGTPLESLGSTGTLQADQLFVPYGERRSNFNGMPDGYKWAKQNDDNTGLYDDAARYYDPVAAQFISADTMLPGGGYDTWGLSRYAYVEGNPIVGSDPSGHWPDWGGMLNAVTDTVSSTASNVGHAALSTAVNVGWDAVGLLCTAHDSAPGQDVVKIASTITPIVPVLKGISWIANKVGAKGVANATGYLAKQFDENNKKVDARISKNPTGPESLFVYGTAAAFTVATLGLGAADEGATVLGDGADALDAAEDGSMATDDAVAAGEYCSFSADTPVATPHGEQAIGSLQAGEKVEAYNPNTGQTVAEPVQQVLINHDSDLLNLTIRTSKQGTTSPETIHTTDNHPWFTVDRGWVQAGQLRVGEQVLAQDGTRGTVQVLVQVAGSATMYNLSVAHIHTYAVGLGRWVVHNVGCGGSYEDQLSEAQQQYANKAGKTEYHHIFPQYMGGSKNGMTVPIDAAYHQQITNAFREEYGYGQGPLSPQKAFDIAQSVYSRLPLPSGYNWIDAFQ